MTSSACVSFLYCTLCEGSMSTSKFSFASFFCVSQLRRPCAISKMWCAIRSCDACPPAACHCPTIASQLKAAQAGFFVRASRCVSSSVGWESADEVLSRAMDDTKVWTMRPDYIRANRTWNRLIASM